MQEPEPRIVLFEACHGKAYEPGTKKPKDPPNSFEEFDAECVVCRQRIALVLGSERLKLHYAKRSSPEPLLPVRRPKKSRFWESLGGGHGGVAIHMERLLPKRVLFVCIGNSCRSPLAEALARHLAPDAIAASSAGMTPLGYVSESTRTVLAEIGISSAGLESKPLREKDVAGADLLINMTARPVSHGRTAVEDWQVEDPFGYDLAVYRRTRDEIARRVSELAKRLRDSAAKRRAAGR
jgi:arsenate reductase (thioredoxin)